jgi:hypothetical protein
MRRQGIASGTALGAAALAAAFALAACDRVEFEGRVFEAVGLAGNQKTEAKDVPTRAPLVLPPNRSLPPPGTPSVAAAPSDWPDDPDERAKMAASEAQRKRQEYYDKGDWSGKGGIEEFEKLGDPGARRPGIFGEGPVGDRYREGYTPPPKKPREAATEGWTTQTQSDPPPAR